MVRLLKCWKGNADRRPFVTAGRLVLAVAMAKFEFVLLQGEVSTEWLISMFGTSFDCWLFSLSFCFFSFMFELHSCCYVLVRLSAPAGHEELGSGSTKGAE